MFLLGSRRSPKMSRFFRGGGVALKPENSLKRAEELIGVSPG